MLGGSVAVLQDEMRKKMEEEDHKKLTIMSFNKTPF
jgi:hypothetical protein